MRQGVPQLLAAHWDLNAGAMFAVSANREAVPRPIFATAKIESRANPTLPIEQSEMQGAKRLRALSWDLKGFLLSSRLEGGETEKHLAT